MRTIILKLLLTVVTRNEIKLNLANSVQTQFRLRGDTKAINIFVIKVKLL